MDFSTIFGVLGILTAFITFLLPVRSLIRIRRRRIARSLDLFSLSAYQFHAAAMSCTLWVIYGDHFLRIINSVGFFMEFFYLSLFIMFTRGFVSWLKHGVVLLAELYSVHLFAQLIHTYEYPIPVRFVGTVCTIGSILISFSRIVFETSRPPFSETVAAFVNGIVWTFYALVSYDGFILVANVVGGVVGVFMHVQYVKKQRLREIAEEISRTEHEDLPDFKKLDTVV